MPVAGLGGDPPSATRSGGKGRREASGFAAPRPRPSRPVGSSSSRLPRRQARGSQRLSAPTTSRRSPPLGTPAPSVRVTAATRPAAGRRAVRRPGPAGPLREAKLHAAAEGFRSSAQAPPPAPPGRKRAALFPRPPRPVRGGPVTRPLHPERERDPRGCPRFTIPGAAGPEGAGRRRRRPFPPSRRPRVRMLRGPAAPAEP